MNLLTFINQLAVFCALVATVIYFFERNKEAAFWAFVAALNAFAVVIK